LFASYADFTVWPPYDLVAAATDTGLRHATLAFIVADPSQNATNAAATNIPAWSGFTEYSAAGAYRFSDINTFRALGGDVIISFGGESGTELAAYLPDTNWQRQCGHQLDRCGRRSRRHGNILPFVGTVRRPPAGPNSEIPCEFSPTKDKCGAEPPPLLRPCPTCCCFG